jgi:hypothetical protein
MYLFTPCIHQCLFDTIFCLFLIRKNQWRILVCFMLRPAWLHPVQKCLHLILPLPLLRIQSVTVRKHLRWTTSKLHFIYFLLWLFVFVQRFIPAFSQIIASVKLWIKQFKKTNLHDKIKLIRKTVESYTNFYLEYLSII